MPVCFHCIIILRIRKMIKKMKIVIAVTGASGSIYAKFLIEKIKKLNSQVEDIALIFSEQGKSVWNYEIGDYENIAQTFKIYNNDDFYAPFASGSSVWDAMIVCPCSMGTLGRIANGVSNDLISRTGDVMLKERRKLILAIRETPLSLIHIENMRNVSLAGAIVFPAALSFYSKPQNIEDLVSNFVDRLITTAGIDTEHFEWGK